MKMSNLEHQQFREDEAPRQEEEQADDRNRLEEGDSRHTLMMEMTMLDFSGSASQGNGWRSS